LGQKQTNGAQLETQLPRKVGNSGLRAPFFGMGLRDAKSTVMSWPKPSFITQLTEGKLFGPGVEVKADLRVLGEVSNYFN